MDISEVKVRSSKSNCRPKIHSQEQLENKMKSVERVLSCFKEKKDPCDLSNQQGFHGGCRLSHER